jgi:hypothetical protein
MILIEYQITLKWYIILDTINSSIPQCIIKFFYFINVVEIIWRIITTRRHKYWYDKVFTEFSFKWLLWIYYKYFYLIIRHNFNSLYEGSSNVSIRSHQRELRLCTRFKLEKKRKFTIWQKRFDTGGGEPKSNLWQWGADLVFNK